MAPALALTPAPHITHHSQLWTGGTSGADSQWGTPAQGGGHEQMLPYSLPCPTPQVPPTLTCRSMCSSMKLALSRMSKPSRRAAG